METLPPGWEFSVEEEVLVVYDETRTPRLHIEEDMPLVAVILEAWKVYRQDDPKYAAIHERRNKKLKALQAEYSAKIGKINADTIVELSKYEKRKK